MKNKIVPAELGWEEGKVKDFFGKDLLALDNGSFKLVKVAPLASYPEHRHPDKTEFAYVLEGCPEFTIGDACFAANADEFYVFPANVPHAIRNTSALNCLLLIGAIKS